MNTMPEEAIYKGRPSRLVTAAILHLTHTDSQGRRFYRATWGGPWKRLSGSAAFQELNTVVDKYRVLPLLAANREGDR